DSENRKDVEIGRIGTTKDQNISKYLDIERRHNCTPSYFGNGFRCFFWESKPFSKEEEIDPIQLKYAWIIKRKFFS
ncbi:hypothetical protein TNCT_249461, partial [Trichonephila clavata]